MNRVICLSLFLSIAALQGPGQGKPAYTWHRTPESLALYRNISGESGQMVWQFNFKPGWRTFFHPVYNPDGVLLTAEAPKDHPWHLGLWFCWKYINGLNYWEYTGDPKNGISEGKTDIRQMTIRTRGKGSAWIRMKIDYHPWLQSDSVVLSEVRAIHAGRPQTDGSYCIDYEHIFTAIRDVVLDRTPPQTNAQGLRWGGYAGLCVRFDQNLSNPSYFSSQSDSMDSGERAPWVAANLKAPNGKTVQMVLFDHPGNVRFPTPWYVINRPNDRFWYFNAALLYHEPLRLQAGEKMRLKYRVLVPAKPLMREEIEGRKAGGQEGRK